MPPQADPGGRPDDRAAGHMDEIYRYQRHFYNLTRKYYLFGRDRMLAGLLPPEGGTVLEVGCGTARNLIISARRYPRAQHFGFDISREMLTTAEASVARAGLSQRITLAPGDATNFNAQSMFGTDAFDRVFLSYTLSMIPPWRESLRHAFTAVRPGGSMHIADFGQQSGYPNAFRTFLRGWLARFSVEPRADLEAELRGLAHETGAELTFTRLYRDYAQLAVLKKPSK
jgi:S-adenosylmethionine-diacylgycerolhomoserine-N-methlytransferase